MTLDRDDIEAIAAAIVERLMHKKTDSISPKRRLALVEKAEKKAAQIAAKARSKA